MKYEPTSSPSARQRLDEVVESSRTWLPGLAPTHEFQIEVAGVAEIAKEYGVRATVVSMWDARRDTNGFPEPLARLKMGPVYLMPAVREWHKTRRTRKVAPKG